jgi:hypothetical protein
MVSGITRCGAGIDARQTTRIALHSGQVNVVRSGGGHPVFAADAICVIASTT